MSSVSEWTTGILFTILFVGVLALVVANMNLLYDENMDIGITDNSGTEELFVQYQDTAEQQLKGGEVEFDAEQGVSVKSSWGLLLDSSTIAWGFLTGGFIENAVAKMNLGEAGTALGRTLRIVFFLSLVFAILYALFKVKT
jgi:hypothetical protein